MPEFFAIVTEARVTQTREGQRRNVWTLEGNYLDSNASYDIMITRDEAVTDHGPGRIVPVIGTQQYSVSAFVERYQLMDQVADLVPRDRVKVTVTQAEGRRTEIEAISIEKLQRCR